jgi:hypothetical protein
MYSPLNSPLVFDVGKKYSLVLFGNEEDMNGETLDCLGNRGGISIGFVGLSGSPLAC